MNAHILALSFIECGIFQKTKLIYARLELNFMQFIAVECSDIWALCHVTI